MYFQVVTTSAGFHARIKDGNHEIIFVTQVYRSKQSAMHACHLLQTHAAGALIYEAVE